MYELIGLFVILGILSLGTFLVMKYFLKSTEEKLKYPKWIMGVSFTAYSLLAIYVDSIGFTYVLILAVGLFTLYSLIYKTEEEDLK